MLAILAHLITVCAATTEGLFDIEEMSQVNIDSLNEFVDSKKDLWVSESVGLLENMDVGAVQSNCSKKCCHCVAAGAEEVMKMVMEKVDAFCKSPPKCEFAKHFCAFVEHHRKMAEGLMMAKVHPLSLAGAWCCGHGDCAKEESMNAIESLEGDYTYAAHAEALKENLQLEWLQEDVEHLDSCPAEPQAALCQEGNCPADDKKFKCCVQHATLKVFKKVLKKTAKMCEKPPCKPMEKFCEWAAKNKEVAAGVVLGVVQPWKFAVGYCWSHRRRPHQEVFEATTALPETYFLKQIVA